MLRIGLVVSAVLLSGCLGNVLEDSPTEIILPWGLTDCQAVIAIVPVPTSAVAPHLPEGFRSLSMEEVLETGTEFAGEANLGLEAMTCASGVGLDGEVEGMTYGSFFTAVEAPPELAEDTTLAFVKWETMIPDDDRRALLESYGLPVFDGTATIDFMEGQGNQWGYAAQLDLAGMSISMQGMAGQPPDASLTFVEYMETERGLVRWHATVDASSLGAGPATVTFTGTGRPATMLDGPTAGAAYGGMVSFTTGDIVIPA